MKYKIGEVSKILKISDQMIRYYEKCGVITPHRSGDGQYRYYTDMDIFLLFDAMRYKEWGINIADINSLVSEDYYGRLAVSLGQHLSRISREIAYNSLLQKRISFVSKDLLTCRYNKGNYWVDLIPEHYMYYMGTSHKDEYDISVLDDRMAEQIYAPEKISFFDVIAEYDEDHGSWWYGLKSSYHDALKIRDFGDYKLVPEMLCLTTVMDMGEPGEFDRSKYSPFLEYARDHSMTVSGTVKGRIIGRGIDNRKFCRLMQIMVPVKTL